MLKDSGCLTAMFYSSFWMVPGTNVKKETVPSGVLHLSFETVPFIIKQLTGSRPETWGDSIQSAYNFTDIFLLHR